VFPSAARIDGRIHRQRVAIDHEHRQAGPSPETVVVDFATLLHTYHVTAITGDRWGGESPREAFAKHGIVYEVAAKPKSDVYRDVLPLLNSGRVELLDHPRRLARSPR
jgi:hypothetical protein